MAFNSMPAAVLLKRVAVVATSCAALVVAGQQSAGFALSRMNPPLALSIAPGHGDALAAMVTMMAARAKSKADLPAIHPIALKALSRAPWDHDTAQKLAVMSVLEEQPALATRLFSLIAGTTLRDDLAHVWMLSEASKRKDFRTVAREADIILRHGDPSQRAQTYTMVNLLVTDGSAIPDLVSRLAANPKWRPSYLDYMGEHGRARANERRLLYALRRTASPPTARELQTWFVFQAPRVPQAELVADYLALSPVGFTADERYLRDGNFEGTRAVGPFKWTYFNGEHAIASVGPTTGGNKNAMFVDFDGRVAGTAAEQILTADPGRYQISWRTNGIASSESSEPQFQISCTRNDRSVETSEVDIALTINQWTAGRASFSVPSGCRRLTLGIRYEPSGLTNQPVQFYLDDIVIRRLASAPVRAVREDRAARNDDE